MSLIRRAPKRFAALFAMIVAAIIVPAVVLAWGPSRPTFTGANPAPYVTFNSITDNPQVGDERNFVRIREEGSSTYVDNVNLTPGKVYEVSVFYHNDASSDLNASGVGIAKDTTLKMQIPGIVKSGVNAAFTGTVSASNSNPLSVWDEAYGKNNTNGEVVLRYVDDSAYFVSNGAINGQKLPDTLFTTGAKLGYDAQDGKVPGCAEYAGFVNFKFVVDQPNFTVQKEVSVDGKTWHDDTVEATPGSTVQYRIVYQNTGTTQQDNVMLRDILPQGVSYVPGSSLLANSVTGGVYKTASDGIASNGYNAGSYQPNGNVFFKFSAKLPEKSALECGTNTLVNTARVTTSSGYKEDTANITLKKECQPEAKYKCDTLNVQTISRGEFKFTTQYTAENATFKGVTYVIRDASGTVIATETTTGTTYTYKQEKAGKYTVQATVTFEVDGQLKTATSEGCKSMFEVPEQPKDIVVCDLTTFQIVTIKESDFNPEKYSKDLEKCKNIKVCELATKQIVTIKAGEFDSSKYSKDLKDCETPETMTVCDLTTKQIVTINKDQYNETKYTTDLSKCEETPVTPPELPTTGIGENIAAIVGLGALIASLGYYIASRRALNQ